MRFLCCFLLSLLLTSSVLADGAGIEWEILNDEANELVRIGKYQRATIVAKKALEIAEENVGINHIDVGISLNRVASCYSKQGLYKQAEPLYKRALSIAEQILGSDHPIASIIGEKKGDQLEASPL